MLTDAGAIGLALVAARLAPGRRRERFTFGLGRAEILTAQVNGAALLVLAGVLAIEAVRRLLDPPDVEGGIVIVVGVLGARGEHRRGLGARRAPSAAASTSRARCAHVLADLYGSVAAVVAGVVILTAGFELADGIAALLVAALMLRSGWRLLRDSGRMLLEGAPQGIDPERSGRALAAQRGVVEVHDLHVWEVTSGFPALAAHVLVRPGDDCHGRRRELQALLRDRFGIDHTTLQVDHERDQAELLDIERP